MSSAAVSKRHSLKKRPESKSTLTIADVTFEDAGKYTFYEYSHPVTEKKVELTVIGETISRSQRSDGVSVCFCRDEPSTES